MIAGLRIALDIAGQSALQQVSPNGDLRRRRGHHRPPSRRNRLGQNNSSAPGPAATVARRHCRTRAAIGWTPPRASSGSGGLTAARSGMDQRPILAAHREHDARTNRARSGGGPQPGRWVLGRDHAGWPAIEMFPHDVFDTAGLPRRVHAVPGWRRAIARIVPRPRC